MSNILYINHYAGRDDLGMEFRPHNLAKEWVNSGHNVLIVGATYSHLRYKQPKAGYEKVDSVCYKWLVTPKYKGNGIARLFSMLVFVIQLFMNSLFFVSKFKPNVVIASSTYPLDIFPSWFIARLSGAKLVFEIHDLWPMSPIEIGKMNKLHPFVILMAIGEWFSYKLADKVISILPNTYEHVSKFGVKKHNFEVVENGYAPCTGGSKLNAAKNANVVVGYVGSIGPSNALETLIEAAKKLRDIKFKIAGDGTSRKTMESLAAGAKNIEFLGAIPKSEVQRFIATTDVLYLGTINTNLYKYGVSMNKIFDYMEGGKPIIFGCNTTNDPISKSKCGYVIKPESVYELVRTINKIAKTPKAKLTAMGQNGKDYAQKYHQYWYLASKFLKAIFR